MGQADGVADIPGVRIRAEQAARAHVRGGMQRQGRFQGGNVIGKPSRAIAQLGMARTFQHVKMIPDMTVLENVALPLIEHIGLSRPDAERISAMKLALVGLPGVIEHRTGKIRSSPILREVNVNFAEEMTARLNSPTIIESDAHAITLAHHWFGHARDLGFARRVREVGDELLDVEAGAEAEAVGD